MGSNSSQRKTLMMKKTMTMMMKKTMKRISWKRKKESSMISLTSRAFWWERIYL